MSKHNRKKKKTASNTGIETAISDACETAEGGVSESEPASEGEASDENGEFIEREITESETKQVHERFKFDWELEEQIVEALDEDASELENEEEPEPEPISVKTVSATKAAQTLFGLFVLFFTIVGVIATGFKIHELAEAQKDDSAEKAYFEDFLMPIVASDSPIFDGAASLNEDIVITAACWDIIFNPSVFYEYSAGTYKVSYQDIDRRITKLFGPGLNYTHKTVGDTDLTFEYDSDAGMYSIPAYPRSPAYFCEVTSITELDGGNLELTVNYKLPITNWIRSLDTVEKTMVYTVAPTSTGYNVIAIRIGEIIASEAN